MRERLTPCWPRILCAAVLALLAATGLHAQSTTGTLLGTVLDSAGGVLTGASVTATQRDTGFTRSGTTDAAGAYTFANMPLGRYDIKAERDGFKAKIVGPVTLVVDQRLRTDIVLELGRVQETVEVAGTATLLQTDQPDVNQIVQEKEIKALPLNGRDFFSLLLLSNGIQDTSNDQGGATTNVTFSVNGMRPEANSVTLDGVQMASVRESDVDLRPNVDAISEFKVLTSVFSAEYGHTAGGVISIQTKSGTNAFHGSAFEFHRNDALNAANYFRNPVNPDKAPLKQHQFGLTLGGPLRKDRTFFFVDYQGQTVRKVTEAFARVPEEPFRRGDFSALLPGTVIYDPATGGNQPFPNNIIPPERWDRFGWTLLNMVDLPNLPADYPLGNYFVRQQHRIDGHEGGFRIDHVFSAADHVFVRFRMNNSQLFTADALSRPDGPLPGIALGVNDDSRGIVQGGIHDDRNYNAVASHVHLFGSRLVNEARIGFHRYELDVESNAHGRNLAEASGLRGVNRDELSSGLPMLYLDGYYTNFGGDDWKPLYFRDTFWQFNDTLTWTAGRHTLKLGAEYRRRTEDNYFTVFPAGAFYVGIYATSYQLSWWQGHELASLLLGRPSFGYLGRRFGNHVLQDRQYAGFVQDDWKVSDKLTLNLGLRYDYNTPFFSPTNELSMFDLEQRRLLIAGQDGVSRYIVEPDRNNFAPRLGAAYQVNAKTTLRGGFGLFYTPETAKRDEVRHNPPFYRQATFYDQWQFSDPVPPALPEPGPYPTGYDTLTVDKELQTGYSLQYSAAVQRELPGGVLFEAAYVGSQAHKLPFVVNVNQARPDGTPAPFPGIGRVQVIRAIGDSSYHSGQFKLEKRFSEGLFLLGSYTWSRSIDTVSSALFSSSVTGGVQNVFDVKQNRGPSDWDVPHRFSLSYVWELPYGKDDRSSGVLKALFGNWQVSGLFVARSGMPGTVTVGNPLPGGDARPNLLRDPNLPGSERSVDRWFDTTAFVANRAPDGTLLAGDAGRNIIRGPGYVNLDMGLIKFIPVKNDVRLQLRVEAFNLTNTPHFAMPVLRMSDPAFGRITHTRNSTNFGSTATSFANRMIQLAVKLEF
jgi:outer membrane receptor protein involved in Fe transport